MSFFSKVKSFQLHFQFLVSFFIFVVFLFTSPEWKAHTSMSWWTSRASLNWIYAVSHWALSSREQQHTRCWFVCEAAWRLEVIFSEQTGSQLCGEGNAVVWNRELSKSQWIKALTSPLPRVPAAVPIFCFPPAARTPLFPPEHVEVQRTQLSPM